MRAARPFPLPSSPDTLTLAMGYEAADPDAIERGPVATGPAAPRPAAPQRALPPWQVVVALGVISASLLWSLF